MRQHQTIGLAAALEHCHAAVVAARRREHHAVQRVASLGRELRLCEHVGHRHTGSSPTAKLAPTSFDQGGNADENTRTRNEKTQSTARYMYDGDKVYAGACSFRLGAAPAPAGLAGLLKGGIWLMVLKCSSCLFLQMCSFVGFSAQKPVLGLVFRLGVGVGVGAPW